MMQGQKLLIAAIMLSLTFSNFAIAEIGSVNDVIKAAKEGKEPAYIQDLMEQLSKRLHAIAREKCITSSKQRVAWFLTMSEIMSVNFGTASNAGSTAAWNAVLKFAGIGGTTIGDAAETAAFDAASYAAWHTAGSAAWHAAGEAALDTAWHTALNDAGNIAGETAVIAAEAAAQDALEKGATPKEAGVIAFRVAEWATLNSVFANADALVGLTYASALDALSHDLQNDPFASREAFIEFYNKYFATLSDGAMIFLAPWLVSILPLDWIPDVHQHLFAKFYALLCWPLVSQFSLGYVFDANSLIQRFPREVTFHVLRLALFVFAQQLPANK